jgi:hypothetical protein
LTIRIEVRYEEKQDAGKEHWEGDAGGIRKRTKKKREATVYRGTRTLKLSLVGACRTDEV